MAVWTKYAPRHLRYAAAAILALGLAGFLFAWSGVYNVGATSGHWRLVEWALAFGMRNSVETRALAITSTPAFNDDMVRLGAAHFDLGCAPCHGAPGRPPNPIAQSMMPNAPELTGSADRWKDRELFWIVKHGIKYTGMPSWVSQNRDDEVWMLVAFLKKLPALDAASYAALGRRSEQDPPAISDAQWLARWRCAGCHGDDGSGITSNLVPRLNGQRVEFLDHALRAYAKGTRESGIMQPIASDLKDFEIKALATYYASLSSTRDAVAEGPAAGRTLALEGAPDAGIPACISCHSDQALPIYPRLAGQSNAYLMAQLRLWKKGFTPADGSGAIMAPIAQRLTEQQIEDVSSYFAAQPGPSGSGRPQ